MDSLEVARMFHLLTWVCAIAGFDLFNITECETRFLFYLATHELKQTHY